MWEGGLRWEKDRSVQEASIYFRVMRDLSWDADCKIIQGLCMQLADESNIISKKNIKLLRQNLLVFLCLFKDLVCFKIIAEH